MVKINLVLILFFFFFAGPATATPGLDVKKIEERLLQEVSPSELPVLLLERAYLFSKLIKGADRNLEPILMTLAAANDYLAQEMRWRWELGNNLDAEIPNWKALHNEILDIKKNVTQILVQKYQMTSSHLKNKNKTSAAQYYIDLIKQITDESPEHYVFPSIEFTSDGIMRLATNNRLVFQPSYYSSQIAFAFYVSCYYLKVKNDEKLNQYKQLLEFYTGYPHQNAATLLFRKI